jgi:peptidoglycan/LPS O-acetylase OafA/YrhL
MEIKIKKTRNIGITRSNAIFLKAIACMMIVVHHYFHLNGIHSNIFTYIISAHFGYIFVSLFFLLSAYGLTESESNVNNNFFQFIKKRLLRVYYPVVLINILTIILYYICGYEVFSIDDICLYILGIKLIDPFLWYVNVSLLFYVFFWISFRMENSYKVIMLFFLSIIYMLIAHFYLKLPGNLYMSVLSFPIGMCCSLYKYQISRFVASNLFYLYYFIYVIGVLTLFFVFHKMGCQIIKTICMSFILVPFYFYLAQFNLLKSKVLNFIGGISYEIYLVHLKVFILLGFFIIEYRSLWLFITIVIAISFIFNRVLFLNNFLPDIKN